MVEGAAGERRVKRRPIKRSDWLPRSGNWQYATQALFVFAFWVSFITWGFNFELLHVGSASGPARWAAVACCCLVGAATYFRRPAWTPWPLLALAAALALSIPASGDRARSVIELARVCSFVLLALVAARLPASVSTLAVRSVIWTSIIITLVSAVFGVAHVAAAMQDGRLIGASWHPALIGFIANVALAGVFSGVVKLRSKVLGRLAQLITIGAVLYVLRSSDSRTGEIVAVLIVLAAAARPLLASILGTEKNRRVAVAIAVPITLCIFIAPMAIGVIYRQTALGGEGARAGSIQERVKIWSEASDAFISNPLTGSGFASGGPITKRYDAREGYGRTAELPYYHSFFPNSAATGGAITLAAAAWVIADIVACILRGFGRSAELDKEPLETAYVAAFMLLPILGFALLEGGLQGMYVTYIVWILSISAIRNANPPRKPSLQRRPPPQAIRPRARAQARV